MQIIGFNFTKMSAEKLTQFKRANITNDVRFINIEKEQLDLLTKEAEAVRISFSYALRYEDPEKKETKTGEVSFEGNLILSMTKEELKQTMKTWKKKQVPSFLQMPLLNTILHKCTPKAAYLQDEISLPSHLPVPRVALKPEQQD